LYPSFFVLFLSCSLSFIPFFPFLIFSMPVSFLLSFCLSVFQPFFLFSFSSFLISFSLGFFFLSSLPSLFFYNFLIHSCLGVFLFLPCYLSFFLVFSLPYLFFFLTMLQAGRSRVRFPMRSFDFSIDPILPAGQV
jgi:hypothetical protein